MAGRLKHFAQRWTTITNNYILDLLQGVKLLFHSKPKHCTIRCNTQLTKRNLLKYTEEISSLLQKGAISECKATHDQYLSPFFLVKKPNNKFRFIINLKSLNKFISVKHFKIEDYRTATRLTSYSSFFAKLDLRDAYFLLPIHPKYKRYLRFKFRDKIFDFNCIPFGLNIAPYIFTKLLKPVTKFLRSQGCTFLP